MAFKPETLMGTNRVLKYAGNRHIYEVLAKFSASEHISRESYPTSTRPGLKATLS